MYLDKIISIVYLLIQHYTCTNNTSDRLVNLLSIQYLSKQSIVILMLALTKMMLKAWHV